MEKIRIGIIDSGDGGQLVANKLIELFGERVDIYQYNPWPHFESYATSSLQRLFCVCDIHIESLLESKVDLIIVACMTLSTNCLEYINQKVGDEVAVYDLYTELPYLSDDTIVFATPNTMNSGRFSYCKTVPCKELSSYIENKEILELGIDDLSKRVIQGLLKGYLANVQVVAQNKIIVLGCSHYSIIKEVFQEQFNPIEIIDPVEIVVERVGEIINEYERRIHMRNPFTIIK